MLAIDHAYHSIHIVNDWHGNWAAHAIMRASGEVQYQGPWRTTPEAALKALMNKEIE